MERSAVTDRTMVFQGLIEKSSDADIPRKVFEELSRSLHQMLNWRIVHF
jgi:hypothetical protein